MVEETQSSSVPPPKEKKKYLPTFTDAEIELLLDIVTKYKDIVEDKATDSESWRKKARAWEQIKEDFNTESRFGVFRPIENLKNKYDGLKKALKRKRGQIRCEKSITIGEHCFVIKLKPSEKRVSQLLSSAAEEPESEFDSVDYTTGAEGQLSPSTNTIQALDDGHDNSMPEDPVSLSNAQNEALNCNNDWSQYSVAMFAKPVSSSLQPSSPTSEQGAEPSTTVIDCNSMSDQRKFASIVLEGRQEKRRRSETARSPERSDVFRAMQTRCLEVEHAAKMRILVLEEERLKRQNEREERKFELEIKILEADLALKNKLLSS